MSEKFCSCQAQEPLGGDRLLRPRASYALQDIATNKSEDFIINDRGQLFRQLSFAANDQGSLDTRSRSRLSAADADLVVAATDHPVSAFVHVAQIPRFERE